MLATVFQGNKKFNLGIHNLPKLGKDELLIRIGSCGICGTDRHIYEGKAPSSIPIILGHEFSGTIVEKGNPDLKFEIGQKVVIDPNIYCGHCDYCRKGMVNFCENLKALGVTLNGGFAEYCIVPSSQAYILPDDFDLSVAAFSEPLSCCLRGINNADIRLGNTVVIIGGGSIGLLMVQLVRIKGASKIILIEPNVYKQKLGIKLGADYAFNPDSEKLFKQINDITNNQVDIVLECVGNKDAVNSAIKIAGKGGKVVIFGLAPNDQTINLNLQHLFQKELKIFNSYLNPFTFKSAVDLLVNRKISVKELLTKQLNLIDIPNFFSDNIISDNIKVQIINN
jgi:2-desacetyl-2-hydroxyethyl bacteriochlorophyllide A dehydrogenase